MQDAIAIVKDIGLPAFIALFVLIRIEPAIKRLERSIMAMTATVARLNGIKESEVEAIVGATSKRHPMRRITDLKNKKARRKGEG